MVESSRKAVIPRGHLQAGIKVLLNFRTSDWLHLTGFSAERCFPRFGFVQVSYSQLMLRVVFKREMLC